MTDILEFKRPPEPPTSKYGEDATWLKMCASWRAYRAQQQFNWASNDRVTMFNTDGDAEIDLEPLGHMQTIEQTLGEITPRTAILARELLRVALTILAHGQEHPEGYMSQGPVLEIVRNVVKSLEWLDADTVLGPKEKPAG